jgi:hypothetical protein
MWIYTRHDEAVGNWNSKPAMPTPESFEERLGKSFGIDMAKAKNWCTKYSAGPLGEKKFNHHAPVQFDLFFQIAGLNRKIRALKKITDPDQLAGVADELEACEANRERLITLLRKGAADAGSGLG